jgi:hypothetical protein
MPIEKVPYLGFQNNLRLANDRVEVLLSTDYGPRIIRYAPIGGDNVFAEISPEEQTTETPFGDGWHIYGGHRLWYAPEHPTRTYWPDNAPVAVTPRGDAVTLTQPVEGHTQLEKEMEVSLAPGSSQVTVVHRIRNRGFFDVELAVWALSVMAAGGRGIFPNAPFVPHPIGLVPARPLVLWPYTRLHDPRWTFGDRYFQLRQDTARKDPQKVGFFNAEGWVAYARQDVLFVKRYAPELGPHARHADFGCNTETFTNEVFLEVETLGPTVRIAPGEAAEHVERWFLFPGVQLGDDEDAMARALDPILRETAAAGDR